jgi:diacylglycerol kinase (CTP)
VLTNLQFKIGFLSLFLYSNSYSLTPVIRLLSGGLLVVVAAEVLRFRNNRFEAFYEKCLGFLMRDAEKVGQPLNLRDKRAGLTREQRKTNGVVWYLCGVLFALIAYPLDVAVVSILM